MVMAYSARPVCATHVGCLLPGMLNEGGVGVSIFLFATGRSKMAYAVYSRFWALIVFRGRAAVVPP